MGCDQVYMTILLCLCMSSVGYSVTHPGDLAILNDFKNGLENPELLDWPEKGDDPCGPPLWPHVYCSDSRVTQIQAQNMGLKGPLPKNFNQLVKLQNLGLQGNKLNGALPSFSGLLELQYAFLNSNEFDAIPLDFFHGLSSVRNLALDENPFNASSGWSVPDELQESAQLVNFSCSVCNLVGPLPDFFGKMPSLSLLTLASNNLSGSIPESFRDSVLQILWLNNQGDGGMTGTIDVIGSMTGLTQVWLHGNQFSGTIPDSIGDLTSLQQLNLNGNKLVGLIPPGLTNLSLSSLILDNNMLMGPIPKFKAANVTYSSNSFCLSDPGEQCSPTVNALLDFIGDFGFPLNLASQWTGNDPCQQPWLGIVCNSDSQVSVINLRGLNLNGTLSPSLANLDSLQEIHLDRNNLSGVVPMSLTQLKSLRLLDIKENNFAPPLPKFSDAVKINIDGNPQLVAEVGRPPKVSPVDPSSNSSKGSPPSSSKGSTLDSPKSYSGHTEANKGKSLKPIFVVAITASPVILVLAALLYVYCYRKKKDPKKAPVAYVVHPRDISDPNNMVKITLTSDISGYNQIRTGPEHRTNGGTQNTHVIEDGNAIISVQVLRKVTENFAPKNEIGRGGFGAVYKGELEDGTKLAVKRMEAGVVGNKAVDEFQAEIGVLSKVRHRHLVSLLGYSVEGKERLLVYEYMPQGALSMHLFRWKNLNLEPLSWAKRLTIALDVARGMEYLHNLARQIFIHRDLKSSNILLGDDFRAKISDFGLVKLAPDRDRSIATRLAGTFGYLAPEYAVTGKITTKADVFSFGVVLMELLTGLMALDEHRSAETRYLAEWFSQIKSDNKKLADAVDPVIDAKEENFDSISIVADLAGHCTERDPNHRPDMGHAVNVLGQLVEKWKPFDKETEDYSGIDYNLPLRQMLNDWKETDTVNFTNSNLQDSTESIPYRPTGFAASFTSADAR
ncbi:receptor protein kinase TMK1-like [Apium graveolens]|uniref:receptor protein kinase TMK1-like n=1 Tax=Apium graveolens TaxID=4045 RepID=UPI003D7A3A20